MILDVSKIEYKNFNERDVEVPALMSVVRRFIPGSVLDVGAHYSWYTYASGMRKLIPVGGYDAVDLLEDAKTAEIVDRYRVSDVGALARERPEFDMVFSVSVVEHVGIKPVRHPAARALRCEFVTAMLSMTKNVAFLTFPYGLYGECPGEAMNVTNDELTIFESLGASEEFASETQFFQNKRPAFRERWFEVSRQEASSIPLTPALGATCVGLLLFRKES